MIKISAIFLLFISVAVYANDCRKILSELGMLYTKQTKEMLTVRIENATNKHKFLRSFIPYYYKRSFDLRESLPVYSKLKNHTGQIVGDAHVENFGFIVNNKGKPKFTMNDFDDTAEAPLFLDVMRLSQSASYVADLKQAKLIEAYKKGLTNSKRKFSNYTEKLSKKAAQGGSTSKADFTMTKDGPRFSEKSAPSFDTTSKETELLLNVLTKKYKNVKMHDSYRTMKESGGSAFGIRYHALIELDGKTHMIEFKEIMEGGIVKDWVKKNVAEDVRVQQSMNQLLGNDFDQFLDVVKVGNRPFQIRFKLEGNKSIDLGKVAKDDLKDVIGDEFYLLGQLHRTSLGGTDKAVAAYAKDLDTVKVSDWEKSVEIMQKEIKAIYNGVRE